MANTKLVVLGASDPEMAAIERLCHYMQVPVLYAAVEDRRVHPGNTYEADNWLSAGTSTVELAWAMSEYDTDVVLVECGFVHEPGNLVTEFVAKGTYARLDHHQYGDPGYGLPPDQYIAGSSIGQFLDLFGLSVEEAEEHGVPVRLVAAADHCLMAAYHGKCPEVDPDALMKWRVESHAAFQNRTVDVVMANVMAARVILLQAVDHKTCSNCGGFRQCFDSCDCQYMVSPEWADLRGRFVPELPEAACREGIAFLSTVKDRDGRKKVVLQAAGEGLVERFLAGEIVPGLVEMYGDPTRGFGGGYYE